MSDLPGSGPFSAWFEETHPERLDRLPAILSFTSLLYEASARMALVSRADREQLLERHVQECLAKPVVEAVADADRLLDVGTGGGLPGVLLAILFPDTPTVWLEPRERKASFLDRAALQLGLRQARVEKRTLEEFSIGSPAPFDRVTARAIRWDPSLVSALEAVSTDDARLVRFGAAAGGFGAESTPLGPDRSIQVWPRDSWKNLPKAP